MKGEKEKGKPATLRLKAIHYPPGRNPPAMAAGCVFQTKAVDGVAYALLLSKCGKLVVQRARVGSAILAADGKPHVEVADILTTELADFMEAAAEVFTTPDAQDISPDLNPYEFC